MPTTFTANHKNRLGFILLGLTNNFAYVIMLSAAYDLLKQSESPQPAPPVPPTNTTTSPPAALLAGQKYCNEHSTSTILLADTIPSLSVKLLYPFLLVGLPVANKAIATALLSAASFLITGFSTSQVLIFTGVACASFSSGLGESTYLSNTPLYGDVALSGWSMGTGGAGLFGAAAYALLRMIISIKTIMILMLIVPVTMLLAYFIVIEPVDSNYNCNHTEDASIVSVNRRGSDFETNLSVISTENSQEQLDLSKVRNYGGATSGGDNEKVDIRQQSTRNQLIQGESFDFRAKVHFLLSLSKYFLPLLLVYFAEYFINQGLFELIYYEEVTFLDHAAQYRWFQVTYQLGVMISRSSLDLVHIKQLWTMSLLQGVNALLFLAHVCKLIHIPSFYIVIGIIVYEGLLGGFTYANTFYRMKKELTPSRHEFGVSTVTIADTLGIVMAGAVALPVHNALCKLYE